MQNNASSSRISKIGVVSPNTQNFVENFIRPVLHLAMMSLLLIDLGNQDELMIRSVSI
jgi:hypothetical protein